MLPERIDQNYPIMDFPQQNAMQALEAAQENLEARLQEQNDKMLVAMFKRIDEMGQLKRALKEEKFRLTSENVLLKNEITELMITNESMLTSYAETVSTKIETIYQKFNLLYQDLTQECAIAKKINVERRELAAKLGGKSTEYHQIVYHQRPQYGEAVGIRSTKHYSLQLGNQTSILKSLQQDSIGKLIKEAKAEAEKPSKSIEIQLRSSVEDRRDVIFTNNAISQVFYSVEKESQRKIEKRKNFNLEIKQDNLSLTLQKNDLKEIHDEEIAIYRKLMNKRLFPVIAWIKETTLRCETQAPLALATSKSTSFCPHTRWRYKKISEINDNIAKQLREIQADMPDIQ